jgi:hypothetical protein
LTGRCSCAACFSFFRLRKSEKHRVRGERWGRDRTRDSR